MGVLGWKLENSVPVHQACEPLDLRMSLTAKATCRRGKDRFSRRKERLVPWQQVWLSGKVGREVYGVCSEDQEEA